MSLDRLIEAYESGSNSYCTRKLAKMVYDWSEEKEQICYRMYIEEKKSLEEIMDYMKEEHKFAPRYVRTHP